MTTIPPPDNNDGTDIIIPYVDEELGCITEEIYNSIKERLAIKPWKCPKCGLTNFGRNRNCADFRCRLEKPNV